MTYEKFLVDRFKNLRDEIVKIRNYIEDELEEKRRPEPKKIIQMIDEALEE